MYLRFAYVSTGIGVFPVAKLVVLYACVSYREGSRGRSYVFNVDHSVKRCNIDVITLLPTNHQVDHFCVLLSLYGLDRARARALKSCWETQEKDDEEEATETSQYIQKVFLSYTYKKSPSGTIYIYSTHPTKSQFH